MVAAKYLGLCGQISGLDLSFTVNKTLYCVAAVCFIEQCQIVCLLLFSETGPQTIVLVELTSNFFWTRTNILRGSEPWVLNKEKNLKPIWWCVVTVRTFRRMCLGQKIPCGNNVPILTSIPRPWRDWPHFLYDLQVPIHEWEVGHLRFYRVWNESPDAFICPHFSRLEKTQAFFLSWRTSFT